MPAMNDLETNTNWEEEIHSESSNGHSDLSDIEESLEPSQSDEKETITFRRSHLYSVLLPVAFVLGLSVGYLFWGRTPAQTASVPSTGTSAGEQSSSGQTGTTAQNQPNADQFENIVRYDVPVGDNPVLGPNDAPITIIEFSDYECPYCQKWHSEVFGRLLETYSGQIRFVYRDFPLTSIHANAFSAAEAALCAGDQGAYWQYHDQLFFQELGLGKNAYQQYAQQLGLDMTSFNSCVESRVHQSAVQEDFDFAAQVGIRSTPTFFINGIALVGAQSFETFQQVIDNELAGNIP
jgi:protein-disulfide isomerase